MRTNALRQFEVISNADIETARDVVGRYIQPHALKPESRRATDPQISFRHARGRKIGLSLLHYAGDVTIDPDAFENFFLLQFPISGRSVLRQAGRDTATQAGSGWITSLKQSTLINQSGDVLQYVLKFESEALQAACSSHLFRTAKEPLRFEPLVDTGSPRGASLWRCIQFLASEYTEHPGAAAHPLVLAQLEEALITALLMGQPNNYSDALHAGSDHVHAPRPVRLMLDQLMAAPEQEWTLGSLAAAAGVSPRTLQMACQRHLGQPPMAVLRDVRLERVRQDLLSAGPELTVTEIAMRWGFYQLGRFAGDYRQRFGETPSATIRRGSR